MLSRLYPTVLLPLAVLCAPAVAAPASLFDGRSLDQWEGNEKLWRVKDGLITGGSLTETVQHNDFLATRKRYGNFDLRLKIRVTGADGFINSGIQIRSDRVPGNSEMAGYQCDAGIGWWGKIYDESRRNRVIANPADEKALTAAVKENDWNDYRILAEGPRIRIWINGVPGSDYTEADPKIPLEGHIGIQVHGGGKALVQVKDITIDELPPTPQFRGAPEPKKPAQSGPLTAEEEKASFSLPEEFEAELVLGEDEAAGIGKFIATAWDAQHRLWTMTALEYPVDANENRAEAEALFARGGKDKVLVVDQPFGPGPHRARVWAEGLAMPLGLLPEKDAALVQYGGEIRRYRDTNGDGKADTHEIVLTGFGIEDSHLFPHQFTRSADGWVYLAQGAFNHSRVRRPDGKAFATGGLFSRGAAEVKFDFCKLARMRPDGSDFQLLSSGPNNIWGLHVAKDGQMFIQEANDIGYPVIDFLPGMHVPGIGNDKLKPYAPMQPAPLAPPQMGGTGLSGLAAKEDAGWPEPYSCRGTAEDGRWGEMVIYVANPITSRIQAVRATWDDAAGHYVYAKLPDFLISGDERFRPVAICFGPDGALYITDWYNKIISHNEVPRKHPDRDKVRGRIWRVRAKDQPREPRADRSTVPAVREFKVDGSLDELAKAMQVTRPERDAPFRAYMIRAALENRSGEIESWLNAPPAGATAAQQMLFALALPGEKSAPRVAALLQKEGRAPTDEELLRLAEFHAAPGVAEALAALLSGEKSSAATTDALVRLRTRVDAAKLADVLTGSALAMISGNEAATGRGLQLAEAYKLKGTEEAVISRLEQMQDPSAALRALAAMGCTRGEVFARWLAHRSPAVRAEALAGLAGSPAELLKTWPGLNAAEQAVSVARLSAGKTGAEALVAAVNEGRVQRDLLDGSTIDRLQAVLGKEHAGLGRILQAMGDLLQPVLALDGHNDGGVESALSLEGAFTLEAWVRLDPDISNADGILGGSGVLDMNFYGGLFRIWAGGGLHDVIISKKPVSPGAWTHVAVTRTADGSFTLYQNGELDTEGGKKDPRPYPNLRVAWTAPGEGTKGQFAEFRIWNRALTAAEMRATFDRSFAGAAKRPDGLTTVFGGADWGRLTGPAKILRTTEGPPLLSDAAAEALAAKLAKFKTIVSTPGDAVEGKRIFTVCQTCHQVAGEGLKLGPPLDGSAHRDTDSLLRALLTPDAAVEGGYRIYRVTTKAGALSEGFLVSRDDAATVLRLIGGAEQRIETRDIATQGFLNRSLMSTMFPAFIEAMPDKAVRDLFEYIRTLK